MNKEIIEVAFTDIEIGDYLINLGEVLEIDDLNSSSTLVISRFDQKYVFKSTLPNQFI
ncbi:hypothetical protein ABDD95_23685 (plasmid) [Mucilaginibacter sp. PAMB04274]|uniref:hypothetical protein n=1 Tax=Mucilaginibacter sp. PAMB04274 TaxID=3138568 RepID=UPI0031F5F95D